MTTKKLIALFSLAMMSLGAVHAATYSEISVDVSNLPRERQFERLLDGKWRGYTCPPFRDADEKRISENAKRKK